MPPSVLPTIWPIISALMNRAERDLPGLVGELVADVAERHRHDRRRGDAGQEAQHREDGHARDEGAGERAEREDGQAGGHHPELADAIARADRRAAGTARTASAYDEITIAALGGVV